VLMDVRMPGLGGLEAVRMLKQGGSKAAIISVTASGLADSEIEARDAGVDAFVRKPYREGELLAVIGKLLGVRYIHESPAAATAEVQADGRLTLTERLRSLPPDLIDRLRDAAVAGRAKRLESLADQARPHSEAASAAIRALVHEFQYDALVSALPARSHDDA